MSLFLLALGEQSCGKCGGSHKYNWGVFDPAEANIIARIYYCVPRRRAILDGPDLTPDQLRAVKGIWQDAVEEIMGVKGENESLQPDDN